MPARRILVCGRTVAAAVSVVGPHDPGGYDASVERCWFDPGRVEPSAPAGGAGLARRYGERGVDGLGDDTTARVALHGWDQEALAERVDLVVLHYDAAVTSRNCFRVLHDVRGLSAHFLVDVDGTVRQTLDLEHRAWHAGIANDRSIGIEIANPGAFATADELGRWYESDERGLRLAIPEPLGPPAGGPFRPSRPRGLSRVVDRRDLVQADFTDAQYASVAALLDALCATFPRVRRDVPRAADGEVLDRALTPDELAAFSGVLGHWHVTSAKVDPGPAFDWSRVVAGETRERTLELPRASSWGHWTWGEQRGTSGASALIDVSGTASPARGTDIPCQAPFVGLAASLGARLESPAPRDGRALTLTPVPVAEAHDRANARAWHELECSERVKKPHALRPTN